MWSLILTVLIHNVPMGWQGMEETVVINHSTTTGYQQSCKDAAKNFHEQVKANYPKNKVTLSFTCVKN